METHFLGSGNHFLSWYHILFKESFIAISIKRISQSKRIVVFYSELFFLLVKTIVYNPYYYCSLIFWIFLSMEVVCRSKRNVFLNEFSIPASGTDFLPSLHNILLFRNFFLFVKTGGFNFWKIAYFLLIETDFLACGNHFFSSLRHSCHC